MKRLIKHLTILTLFFLIVNPVFSQWAVATQFTPVLNTSDFESVFGGKSGIKVKTDAKGHIRELEFVAYPNTVFTILKEWVKGDHSIYQVETEEYTDAPKGLFIDSRFIKLESDKPESRKKPKFSKEDIIANLKALEGYPYRWGGNVSDGIPKMLEYYQPKANIGDDTMDKWIIKGLDCTGILYQSTGGATPRNSSELVYYGNSVTISGLSAEKISALLQPLDIIVWDGHAMVVLDKDYIIESSPKPGVHKTAILKRVKQIMSERTPVDSWDLAEGKSFVVRRWIESFEK